jgi:hypothetical protein
VEVENTLICTDLLCAVGALPWLSSLSATQLHKNLSKFNFCYILLKTTKGMPALYSLNLDYALFIFILRYSLTPPYVIHICACSVSSSLMHRLYLTYWCLFFNITQKKINTYELMWYMNLSRNYWTSIHSFIECLI